MPRITDKSFVYVPSFATNLGERFKKMRSQEQKFQRAALRELVRAWTEAEAENAERDKVRSSVVPIMKRKAQ